MFTSLTLGLPGFLVGGMNYNYTRVIRFMKVLHSLKLNYLQSWTIFSLCRQVVFSVVILVRVQIFSSDVASFLLYHSQCYVRTRTDLWTA